LAEQRQTVQRGLAADPQPADEVSKSGHSDEVKRTFAG
jgi:hypothetical protein